MIYAAHSLMAAAYRTPGTNVHWYGKDGMKKGRKVGENYAMLHYQMAGCVFRIRSLVHL
jgi:phosphoribosylaminoimidazole carboxylase (NCAIR synthetase)